MAKFVGPKKVEVDGVEYTADNVMIAVGGQPAMPDVPGAEHCINRLEVVAHDIVLLLLLPLLNLRMTRYRHRQ